MKKGKDTDVLYAISDDNSFFLFNTLASAPVSTDTLIIKSRLTRRQYYSRLSSLTNAGLISKGDGRYSLTSFGKMVYEALEIIGRARKNIWKLKAIDSIESSGLGLTIEERIKIIDSLILDDDLKEILLGRKLVKYKKQELVAPQPPLF